MRAAAAWAQALAWEQRLSLIVSVPGCTLRSSLSSSCWASAGGAAGNAGLCSHPCLGNSLTPVNAKKKQLGAGRSQQAGILSHTCGLVPLVPPASWGVGRGLPGSYRGLSSQLQPRPSAGSGAAPLWSGRRIPASQGRGQTGFSCSLIPVLAEQAAWEQ